MDKLRTKLLQSILKTAQGYRPVGSAAMAQRLDAVHNGILSLPKGDQDAAAALYHTLCESDPNRAAGQEWLASIKGWIAIIKGTTEKPTGNPENGGGMTSDDLQAMLAKTAAGPQDVTAPNPHADIIAGSGQEIPETPKEPETPNPHEAIIAQSEAANVEE